MIELEPSDFAYEPILDDGTLPYEVWLSAFGEDVYVPEDPVITEEKGRRWRMTDQEKGEVYNLWKQGETLRIQKALTGYIQVLFDVPYIGRSIRYSLLMHAILIVIVGGAACDSDRSNDKSPNYEALRTNDSYYSERGKRQSIHRTGLFVGRNRKSDSQSRKDAVATTGLSFKTD